MKKEQMNKTRKLIEKYLSDSIFYDNDLNQWCVTTEWLVGTFAGIAFHADTIEEGIEKMHSYFMKHINHSSIVGNIVTRSNYPNLSKVEEYLKGNNDED